MFITMLGTGAALPDPDRAHTAIALTLTNGNTYLLDCGNGATRNLVRSRLDPGKVRGLFFTHLHYDHTADLPMFLIASWILNRQERLEIRGPGGTSSLVRNTLAMLEVDIKARAKYPLRQNNYFALEPNVIEFASGEIFRNEDLCVSAIEVDHIPRQIARCYGFAIEAEGKKIIFSGDTRRSNSIQEASRHADLLIHECTFPQKFIDYRHSTGVGTAAHTSPTELGEIAEEAGVKMLVATHFGHFDTLSPVLRESAAEHLPIDLVGPHRMDDVYDEIRAAYKGPLFLAQDLMRINL